MRDLDEHNLNTKKNRIVQNATEDVIARYNRIPLHAVFLYTSEDPEIREYIIRHWGALDTLSGDICDIHPSVDQFNNVEDAYDYIVNFKISGKSLDSTIIRDLPGILFWDVQGNLEYVPFLKPISSENVRFVVRTVFSILYVHPSIAAIASLKIQLQNNALSPAKVNGALSSNDRAYSQIVKDTIVEGNLIQIVMPAGNDGG